MAARSPVRPSSTQFKTNDAEAAASSAQSLPKPEADLQPIEEKIRRRAYDLYQKRGGQDGSDIEDWLQAEAEMRALEEGVERSEE